MTRPADLRPPPIARVSATRRTTMAAPAERAFELASPLGEYEWIDGWKCDLVHPPSGAMEEGCIFHERLTRPFLLRRPGRTTWVVTRHDPATLEVEFLVFLGGAAIAGLVVDGERLGTDRCAFTWTLTLTALSPSSGKLVQPRRVEAMVGFLSRALAHYCETGERLAMAGLLREHGLDHGSFILSVLQKLGLREGR